MALYVAVPINLTSKGEYQWHLSLSSLQLLQLPSFPPLLSLLLQLQKMQKKPQKKLLKKLLLLLQKKLQKKLLLLPLKKLQKKLLSQLLLTSFERSNTRESFFRLNLEKAHSQEWAFFIPAFI